MLEPSRCQPAALVLRVVSLALAEERRRPPSCLKERNRFGKECVNRVVVGEAADLCDFRLYNPLWLFGLAKASRP